MEEDKIDKQEKNRLAARKCREKKQKYIEHLETELVHLRKENLESKNKLEALRKEINRLNAYITKRILSSV